MYVATVVREILMPSIANSPWRRGAPHRTLSRLMCRMSQENVLWGEPRIQGELAKLGVRVSRTTIAKYMARRPGPPSPTWCTFLHHHASALVAGGVYAELAHRLQASSITVMQVFQRWLASWTTSGAQQPAQGDPVSPIPPSST